MTTLAEFPHIMTDALSQDPPPGGPGDAHWRDIIGQIGSEVGPPLSAALERVTVLATTGKIDRAGLRALREEIERARRAGMIGQQLARFASGRIRQTPEQVSLTQMVREVLLQRGREATARQLEVHQSLKPAEVVIDPTLLHSLLQAMVDWSMDLAIGHIDYKLDIKAWPPHARLVCRFDHAHESEPGDSRFPSVAVDSMTWRLVEQITWTLQLEMQRATGERETVLTLEFPRTVTEQIEGVSVVEIDQGFGTSDNSKPLAGSHVLVVAGGRETRSIIKESIRHMGLLVDFVNSVEEAEEFCRDSLPHAIVYEGVLVNDRFQRLRTSILGEVPGFVFVEITAEGHDFELSTQGDQQRARIGRDAILQSLPSALLFELSRSL